jgi:hypothetical protein
VGRPAHRAGHGRRPAQYLDAAQALRRLGRWYALRYATAGPAAWDQPQPDAWTLREIAEHVANVSYYAEQVGALG